MLTVPLLPSTLVPLRAQIVEWVDWQRFRIGTITMRWQAFLIQLAAGGRLQSASTAIKKLMKTRMGTAAYLQWSSQAPLGQHRISIVGRLLDPVTAAIQVLQFGKVGTIGQVTAAVIRLTDTSVKLVKIM